MDMRLDQPFEPETALPDMGDDLVGIVDIHDGIDHGAGIGIGVFHHIGDGVGCRVEEGRDIGLDFEIGGIGHGKAPFGQRFGKVRRRQIGRV